MPIVCPFLGRIFTGMITSVLDILKMNWGHAQSLGTWHPMSEVGTPPPHNLGMVLRPVAGKKHTHTHPTEPILHPLPILSHDRNIRI